MFFCVLSYKGPKGKGYVAYFHMLHLILVFYFMPKNKNLVISHYCCRKLLLVRDIDNLLTLNIIGNYFFVDTAFQYKTKEDKCLSKIETSNQVISICLSESTSLRGVRGTCSDKIPRDRRHSCISYSGYHVRT